MKINIVKPFLPRAEEVFEDFAGLLDSGMVTNQGPHVQQLESALQDHLRISSKPHAFCNGELALYTLLLSWKARLGFSHRESFKVLVPSFTFCGTINAIVLANLEPVFCDVDETFTIDAGKLPDLEPDVRAVVAVGVYGNLPDVEALEVYARSNNLVLLFDNAPAFGSTYLGETVSARGHDEIYSFHATKGFSTMEGGLAVCNDLETSELVSQIRDFGQADKVRGDVRYPGLNGKMTEISALVGLAQLPKIEDMVRSRRNVFDFYRCEFDDLVNTGILQVMKVREQVSINPLYFPLILNGIDVASFVEKLDRKGVGARRYYTAVHKLSYYSDLGLSGSLEYTESIMDSVVALPIHSHMQESEALHVCMAVKESIGELL